MGHALYFSHHLHPDQQETELQSLSIQWDLCKGHPPSPHPSLQPPSYIKAGAVKRQDRLVGGRDRRGSEEERREWCQQRSF